MQEYERIETLNKLINLIKLDNNLKLQEYSNPSTGEIICRFKKDNNYYIITKRFIATENRWSYNIIQENKKLSDDEILLLYAEFDLNYKLTVDGVENL